MVVMAGRDGYLCLLYLSGHTKRKRHHPAVAIDPRRGKVVLLFIPLPACQGRGNTKFMNKILIMFFIFCFAIVLLVVVDDSVKQKKKPNNQYELFIYQDHAELKDGNRKVGNRQWERNPQIDSLIKADNL